MKTQAGESLPESGARSPDPASPGAASPVPLYAAAFLMDVGLGMVMMGTPWIAARQFHCSAETIGILNGVATACYTGTALSAAVLTRRFSPFARVLAGSALPTMGYLVAGATSSLPGLAAGLWIAWLFLGSFWPALQAQIAAGCGPAEIQRRVGRFNFSWSVGIMLGPAAAGPLYAISPRLPFAAASALALASCILATWGLRGSTVASAAAAAANDSGAREDSSASPFFLWAAWCGHFASYFCSANIRAFFPLLASSQRIPLEAQGYLALELGALQTITFFAMSYAHRWLTRPVTYLAGMTLVAVGMFTASRATTATFAAGFIITGLGMGVTYVLSLFHSLHSPRAARNAGIHEGIVGGAGILGSFSGGFTASHFGLRTPFYLGASTVLVAMAAAAVLLTRATVRLPASNGSAR